MAGSAAHSNPARVGLWYLGSLLAVMIAASSVRAADIEFEIDQETLSAVAGEVTASGTRGHLVWSTQACMVHQIPPVRRGLNPRLVLLDKPFKLSKKALEPFLAWRPIARLCKVPIGYMWWSWEILPSSVRSTAAGLFLDGALAVRFAQGTATQPLSFPVAAAYDAQQKAIELSVQAGSVDVQTLVGGQMRDLGTVDIAPYFATAIPLIGRIPAPGGGQVDVDLTDVQIGTQSGKLMVTADVAFD